MIVWPGVPYGKGGLVVFFAKGAGSWITTGSSRVHR
jgi:hypothetical protein